MDAPEPIPVNEIVPPRVDPLHAVLALCGITSAPASAVFMNIEGLDTIEAFATLNGDLDVTEMAKRMASRSSIAAGKVILGTIQIKRLQALVFWVKDHMKRGLHVDPALWDADELASALARKEAQANYEKVDVDIIDPGKCQTDFGWDAWQIGFRNKLSATLGAAKVPLVYVVRPEVGEDYKFEDEEEVRVYQMPLTGENFKRDNKLVYNMLKAACVKSDAWTWIQDHDKSANGRKAWLALVDHYDGTGELNKRIERAKEEISRLHYRDEKVFPFERYVTKLKENFYILSKDKDENLTNKQRVDVMMKGIRSSDASIVAAKTDVYKDFRSDFDGATSFLSGLIANIHSAAQLDYAARHATGKRRYVSAIDSQQSGGRGRFKRGGRFGADYRGRGGRGRDAGHAGRGRDGRRVRINNVDVTDVNRSFTSEEWERLGQARSYVIQQRNHAGRGRDGRNPGRGSQSAAGQQGDARNTSAAQVTDRTSTNGADDANSQVGDQSTIITTVSERGSQNGRNFGRGAYST
ncbi:hypothetical protein MHU86_25377 [Fragilaria crotonensis]|nr:hypothetical protein MHU86_25377 [Fragilaria crotonensis]